MPQICITYRIPVKIKKFADGFHLRNKDDIFYIGGVFSIKLSI